jgi:hypothetical protein
MPEIDLTDEARLILTALSVETPWRFSNGVVDLSVADRFGDPYVVLDLLVRGGFVSYAFYGTGAVHEFSITESGKAALTDPSTS